MFLNNCVVNLSTPRTSFYLWRDTNGWAKYYHTSIVLPCEKALFAHTHKNRSNESSLRVTIYWRAGVAWHEMAFQEDKFHSLRVNQGVECHRSFYGFSPRHLTLLHSYSYSWVLLCTRDYGPISTGLSSELLMFQHVDCSAESLGLILGRWEDFFFYTSLCYYFFFYSSKCIAVN